MTLKGRTLSDEEMAEVARVVRETAPLRGSRVTQTTTEEARGAFQETRHTGQYRGSGRRGEMRGSTK